MLILSYRLSFSHSFKCAFISMSDTKFKFCGCTYVLAIMLALVTTMVSGPDSGFLLAL